MSKSSRRVVVELQRNCKTESDAQVWTSEAVAGGNGCVGSNRWPPGRRAMYVRAKYRAGPRSPGTRTGARGI